MRSESWLRLMSGFVLVGVFAAGALFGAALLRFVGPRTPAHDVRPPGPPGPPHGPPGPPPGPIEAMTHELDLDAQQRDQLRAIADSHRPELEAIVRDSQPKLRAVLDAIENEMTPHLRPDQVEKLGAWRKRRPPPPVPGLGGPPPGPGGPPPGPGGPPPGPGGPPPGPGGPPPGPP